MTLLVLIQRVPSARTTTLPTGGPDLAAFTSVTFERSMDWRMGLPGVTEEGGGLACAVCCCWDTETYAYQLAKGSLALQLPRNAYNNFYE